MDLLQESATTNLLSLDELKTFIIKKREIFNYRVKHPSSRAILAEHKDDNNLIREFTSLNSLAKEFKGDRETIRNYLKKKKSGFYRGKWKFTYKTTK